MTLYLVCLCINTDALNAITLSLRATNGSVPARRSAAFQHAGVAISPHKQGIASAPPRNDILHITFVLVPFYARRITIIDQPTMIGTLSCKATFGKPIKAPNQI